MIAHDPSLVILSTTIAILGCFTGCVLTSNLFLLTPGEVRLRLAMASLALGGSLWATSFVGLLALSAPLNWTYNPALLGFSVLTAFAGTVIALFTAGGEQTGGGRMPIAVAVLGIAIAFTHYLGLLAIAGRGVHIIWFLAAIAVAVSLQVAAILLWFYFRPRGVVITLAGALGLGLGLSATHYLTVASAQSLELTLAAIPAATSELSARYLAWSATIMTYLVCSICLCIFVIMQFKEEMQ